MLPSAGAAQAPTVAVTPPRPVSVRPSPCTGSLPETPGVTLVPDTQAGPARPPPAPAEAGGEPGAYITWHRRGAASGPYNSQTHAVLTGKASECVRRRVRSEGRYSAARWPEDRPAGRPRARFGENMRVRVRARGRLSHSSSRGSEVPRGTTAHTGELLPEHFRRPPPPPQVQLAGRGAGRTVRVLPSWNSNWRTPDRGGGRGWAVTQVPPTPGAEPPKAPWSHLFDSPQRAAGWTAQGAEQELKRRVCQRVAHT